MSLTDTQILDAVISRFPGLVDKTDSDVSGADLVCELSSLLANRAVSVAANDYTGPLKAVDGIQITDVSVNWVELTAMIGGEWYWAQALVFAEESDFGLESARRVSKISVCRGRWWDHKSQVFNFDRGLDFDNAPDGVMAKILAVFR